MLGLCGDMLEDDCNLQHGSFHFGGGVFENVTVQIQEIWQKWLNLDLNPNLDLHTIEGGLNSRRMGQTQDMWVKPKTGGLNPGSVVKPGTCRFNPGQVG